MNTIIMMIITIVVLYQVTTDHGPKKVFTYERDTQEIREFYEQVPWVKQESACDKGLIYSNDIKYRYQDILDAVAENQAKIKKIEDTATTSVLNSDNSVLNQEALQYCANLNCDLVLHVTLINVVFFIILYTGLYFYFSKFHKK